LLSKTWKKVIRADKRALKAKISSSKFDEKIFAFIARLSVLLTVIQIFDDNSFFLVGRQYIESKKYSKKFVGTEH
jgi:hypothetical protein